MAEHHHHRVTAARERFHRHKARRHQPTNAELAELILDMWEDVVADLSKLQDVVSTLEADEAAAATELKALTDEIAGLHAGEVSQSQIDALTDRATAVATALSSATQSAKDADSPPAPPAPA